MARKTSSGVDLESRIGLLTANGEPRSSCIASDRPNFRHRYVWRRVRLSANGSNRCGDLAHD